MVDSNSIWQFEADKALLSCTYTMVTVQTLANTEANIKQPQSFQSSEKMIDCGFSVFCSLLINIGRLGWQDTLRKVMF